MELVTHKHKHTHTHTHTYTHIHTYTTYTHIHTYTHNNNNNNNNTYHRTTTAKLADVKVGTYNMFREMTKVLNSKLLIV